MDETFLSSVARVFSTNAQPICFFPSQFFLSFLNHQKLTWVEDLLESFDRFIQGHFLLGDMVLVDGLDLLPPGSLHLF